jgi:hypothetical protein
LHAKELLKEFNFFEVASMIGKCESLKNGFGDAVQFVPLNSAQESTIQQIPVLQPKNKPYK